MVKNSHESNAEKDIINSLLSEDFLEPTLLSELKELLLLETEKKQLIHLSLASALGATDEPHKSIEMNIKKRICEIVLDINVSVYGWLKQGGKEPIQIPAIEIEQSTMNIDKNTIITLDGDHYYNCLIVKEHFLREEGQGYLNYEDGILYWANKPLFFWHENPLPEWYSGKPTANSDPEKNITTLSQREIRKNKTSDRNKELFQIYLKTKTENPTKPDTWIANHIAKYSPVKNWGITLETIRRIISDMKSDEVK